MPDVSWKYCRSTIFVSVYSHRSSHRWEKSVLAVKCADRGEDKERGFVNDKFIFGKLRHDMEYPPPPPPLHDPP